MEASDIREKAHQVCKDYLGGSWKTVEKECIIIEKQSGGFVNYIFKLSLPLNITPIADEPSQILMRNIVGIFDTGELGVMTENIIATLLAENNLSPKIYAIFEGGRLEEFISSRGLKSHDFLNSDILKDVVRKIAQLHALTPPVTKNPYFIYKMTEEQLKCSINDITMQIKNIPRRQEVWDEFLSLNPQEEWKWLMKMRDDSNSPVVFSHNDFYNNNILLLDKPTKYDLVQIIDFELAGYNFRSYDLASLFFSFCLEAIPDPPYFSVELNKFPGVEQQKFILRLYLLEFQKSSKINMDIEKELELLLEEYKIFLLIFYFVWIVFCLFTPHRSKESTDWMSFGELALHSYITKKNDFFKI